MIKEENFKAKDIKALIEKKLLGRSIDIVSEINGTILKAEETITHISDVLKVIRHPEKRTVPEYMRTSLPDITYEQETDPRVLLSCGCAMTADNLYQYVEVELMRGERVLTCFNCRKEWDFEDACVKARLSADEKLLFGIKISLNSVGDVCPSCKYYCQRMTEDNNLELWMKCTRRQCSFEFCWICKQQWTHFHKCKLDKLQNILNECPKKVMGHSYIKNVPSIRFCPNCHALIEHIDGCKETQCTNCNKSFCFVCLTMCKENEFHRLELQCSEYDSECTVAPVQTI
ncbi:potential E3 ubiquitin-protein ligase ariadne-2-like [Mytilus edulis]|uniref:potential E3 ubiquitin-protein ligase ariadne-2-like n=1 Tax=Mytilus edulis TaxID=6550 RepID=UPI0039EF1124